MAKYRIVEKVKQLFCRHSWLTEDSTKYAVTRPDGSKSGEVTIKCLFCPKCFKESMIATDRIHYPAE